ncbi:MAG: hypothetical protein A2046_11460 [Bacteroidetes bacterium GWA2_30_7]|nr:MAG: hypothetical protein A2046_11460 [Bacteroidetes bacterium GWA2_30_7]
MNFVYDWNEAREKYTKENKFSILNLNVSYYYIQSTDSDILVLQNGKELLLNNASSGLQSVVPLLVLIDYLTQGLFDEKITDSVDENQEISDVVGKYFLKIIKNRPVIIKQMNDEKSALLTSNESDKISGLIKLIESRNKYHFSQFIIEEPEQNLFPEAQRDLVYYLLNRINDNEREHKLLITTHSPYILYALNNCMMGYLVKEDIPKEVQNELLSKQSWINPELVSVWEIEKDKGTIKLIQDENTKTVSKHYFNKIMNEVMDEYYEMLSYLKI